MNTVITADDLKLWFSGKYFHSCHAETCEKADEIRIHAEGIFPEKLIRERRPNESQAVLDYRTKIWEPRTTADFNKVLLSLNKIRRSSEWSIKFDPKAVPARIAENESLQDYLENYFPYFTSITNWTFTALLHNYAIDANAWIVLMPVNTDIEENTYVQPFPYIFRADQIIEQIADTLLVVISDDKVTYKDGDNTAFGDRYYVITDQSIQQWDQTTSDRRFVMANEYFHGIEELPAFKMRGAFLRAHDNIFINKSKFSGMVPELNKALREDSDLDAEVVQHIYSQMWEMETDECHTCKGKKYVVMPGFGAHKQTCGHCSGTGSEPRGPYTTMYVKKQMAGEAGIPTPPMGYVQKNTDIVKLQDERIDKHIYNALAAVNMQFLFDRPLSESGIAKAYDADETNNTVHSIAEDLVAMIDSVAYLCNEMRYYNIVPDFDTRKAMLPTISVPERFDIFSAQMQAEEIKSARDSKINPLLVAAMEKEYAAKRFSADPDIVKFLNMLVNLDPLSGEAEDDKMVKLSNGGITKETYIISSNIKDFLERAIEERGDDFYSLPKKEQKAILQQYAQEQIAATSTAKAIISDVVSA